MHLRMSLDRMNCASVVVCALYLKNLSEKDMPPVPPDGNMPDTIRGEESGWEPVAVVQDTGVDGGQVVD